MPEHHPFGNFTPSGAKYLFLGSFTGKLIEGYDWFYANKRNQFWSILEVVYITKLPTKKEKQELFTRLKMAITDIILSCERRSNSNLDTNLINTVYNTRAINKIIRNNKIKTIYFSSRFAEELFRKQFSTLTQLYPKILLVTLPSPSPRYATMSKSQKVEKYKSLLPRLV